MANDHRNIKELKKMTGNEYQKLAARTINPDLDYVEMRMHAAFGLASEVGELLGLFQKEYQGHHKRFVKEYPKAKAVDYRPFVEGYLPTQRQGIIICLENGDVLVYMPKVIERTED